MLTLLGAFLGSGLGRFLAVVTATGIAIGGAYLYGYTKGSASATSAALAKGEAEQVDLLHREIAARDAAAKEDAEAAAEANNELNAQLERAKNAVPKISAGVCLTSDDVKRLRSIWASGHGKH